MLVWACIAPHGGELIPDLADGDLARMQVTRRGMEGLGARCLAARPQTLVVLTPHGIEVENHIAVAFAETALGELDGPAGRGVSAAFPVDLELAAALVQAVSERSVPVAPLVLTTAEGRPLPIFPLDFGALVPLWFLGARWLEPPAIVVVTAARSLPRRQLVAAGEAVVEAAVRSGRRVAIVCSADLGHGHRADGPYGFSPTSATHDRAFCSAIRENALHRLLRWRGDWVESAMPDGFWSSLVLHGALRATPLQPELVSYEAPTYFGMACAAFEPPPIP
ncbi:MAG TPA: hypothetical protein VLH79_04530 [Chthonomonadales bacterium]|nr:hypothetical protein [Chthonomonadales bacterium]